MKKWIHFLRVFFPSWEFFGEPGAEFFLEYKIANQLNWVRAIPEVRRSRFNFFWNPDASYYHALNNLVSAFYFRAVNGSSNKAQSLTEYKIIVRYLENVLYNKTSNLNEYEFRIVAIHKNENSGEVVFESGICVRLM